MKPKICTTTLSNTCKSFDLNGKIKKRQDFVQYQCINELSSNKIESVVLIKAKTPKMVKLDSPIIIVDNNNI